MNAVGTSGQTELDREYSPSSLIPSLRFYLREYADLSAAAHTAHRPLTDLAYGSHPQARLDLFPVPGGGSPLVVYVHGGYWQELCKEHSAFPAPDLVSSRTAFAALGYGLAPACSLDEIVTMVCEAVVWLHDNAARFGVDRRRIHLAGSSAGAHLAAMALTRDTARRIAGAALLSGVYDLEPVRHTYVNDALGLDPEAALRNSPVHHLPARLPPVVIARGGRETTAFIRQHEAMTALLARRTAVTEVVCPGRNHFDLPYDLGRSHTALGRAVLAQIRAFDSVSPQVSHTARTEEESCVPDRSSARPPHAPCPP
ncbi:alpha/beta hydrolase [Streptomyces spirodelae]|uniref:Alpha/beta hydrolase n=1 Tax=Streptomyces spirodelae TaxID=2812904 RepID=A0ABS3WX44_9ACTN|nr:alpha/beta hydrolase [Streptomyces spirodelae]MBO8187707.1 alpha/beta hydrolase [Streptomyces spirodelae]